MVSREVSKKIVKRQTKQMDLIYLLILTCLMLFHA